MKRLAVLALCLFSSLASASDMEELVVKARRFEIVLISIMDTHKQNPFTGNWHYVGEKKEEKKEAE